MKNQEKQIHNFLIKYFDLIVFLVIILILASFYFFLINPKVNQVVDDMQEDIEHQTSAYQLQRQRLNTMEKNLAFLQEVDDEDIRKLDEALPASYPREKMFMIIEDIVINEGLSINDLNINKQEGQGQGLQEINIDLSLNNVDYVVMKNFLNKLEVNLPFFDIVFVDFSPRDELLTLSINTYYYK